MMLVLSFLSFYGYHHTKYWYCDHYDCVRPTSEAMVFTKTYLNSTLARRTPAEED